MTSNNKKNNRVSYDDILANMGLYVENGKLHKGMRPAQVNPVKGIYIPQLEQSTPHTIHKVEPVKRVITKEEYINLLLKQTIQQRRNRNTKSTRLIMPTDNIHIRKNVSHDVLFQFSTPAHSINLKGNPNIVYK